jgi:hypothetical protein
MTWLQRFAITLKIPHWAVKLPWLAFTLLCVSSFRAPAQDEHSHMSMTEQQDMTPDARRKAGALLKAVRDATERFRDVAVAEAEGYHLQFGCVSGPDAGAMGLHYVNMDLVKKGVLDVKYPQIVIYEPTSNGGVRLIGADYLLIAAPWDAAHKGPPELMGQLFHWWESPNRFRLPEFYTLHVWAWKDNPKGSFVNWHPRVSCESFPGENP